MILHVPIRNGGCGSTDHPLNSKPCRANRCRLLQVSNRTFSDSKRLLWNPGQLTFASILCSMDGLFLENGPFRFRVDSTSGNYVLEATEHSWHTIPAYTLYIDQPVGTGLSFTLSKTYPRDDNEINVDFYYFLQSFLKLHNDKFVNDSDTLNRPLYFSGESHAGHYIPSMMNHILKQNDNLKDGNVRIPVSGAAIGNGWTDPYFQYAGAEAAYGHGLVGISTVLLWTRLCHGALSRSRPQIGRAQMYALNTLEVNCQTKLSSGDFTAGVCFELLNKIVDQSLGSDAKYKVSSYDIRRSEPKYGSRDFPPQHKVVETYLGGWELKHDPDNGKLTTGVSNEVLKAIHATAASEAGQRYQECTDPPYDALEHQDGKGVVNDVVEVLEHPDSARLLFFNGMEDLVCNHVGNEKFLEHMQWKNQNAWVESERYAWVSQYEEEGKVSGYMKEFANLMFLKLLNSGHMVPLDVPAQAKDMMELFVKSGSFQSNVQSLANTNADTESCPVCTQCLECDPCQSAGTSSETGDSFTTKNLAYVAAVAGLVVLVLMLLYVLFRRKKERPTRTRIPQYDLELREGHYTDSPTNGIS